MGAVVRRVMVVYGTRPEAIKVAPVIAAARRSAVIEPVVAVTGQHREMLDQVNGLFSIVPDFDLDIFRHGQTLTEISTRTLEGVGLVLGESRPDAVLVQGDTTTSTFAALAAFYERIPVVHLEAGLRTDDRYSPFPEEVNRRITTRVASLHLAPTPVSAANLVRDGVPRGEIAITGNTVVDSLLQTAARSTVFADAELERWANTDRGDGPVILVTTHRRENLGDGMQRIADAVAQLARRFPRASLVLPLHRNPAVREVLLPVLTDLPNVRITDPLDYAQFIRMMRLSTVILTDSGGVQEEAPSLGKPVLVMRDTTERPEAVSVGVVKLVGTDTRSIVEEVARLLEDPTEYERMSRPANPYGDGRAAERVVAAVEELLGVGTRLPDFAPTG